MEKSKFQFSNPVLTHLEFELNENFIKDDNFEMKINISSGYRTIQRDGSTVRNSACVTVTVCVGSKDNQTPFYIRADEEATFRWDEDKFSEKELDILLHENAVALLISYVRPIIANVTSSSPYPGYNLPFINLVRSKDE